MNNVNGLIKPFSSESLKQFADELTAEMYAREQRFKDMAKRVFDVISDYPADDPKLEAKVDPVTGKLTIINPAGDRLNEVIGESLNYRSIGHFMELILKSTESGLQSARAMKRHAEHYALKKDVFQWLELQPKFKTIENAATAITRQQPIAHDTARHWYKEWKKLRSAGTP